MKSDTRYSHFVKKKTKSGKLGDSGKYRHFVIHSLRYPVSNVVPAVNTH